jgi:hypothetical protein
MLTSAELQPYSQHTQTPKNSSPKYAPVESNNCMEYNSTTIKTNSFDTQSLAFSHFPSIIQSMCLQSIHKLIQTNLIRTINCIPNPMLQLPINRIKQDWQVLRGKFPILIPALPNLDIRNGFVATRLVLDGMRKTGAITTIGGCVAYRALICDVGCWCCFHVFGLPLFGLHACCWSTGGRGVCQSQTLEDFMDVFLCVRDQALLFVSEIFPMVSGKGG